MSQPFCPRLSDAIGSKILSLNQLFHTPSNFIILQLEPFTHTYLIYGGKFFKNLNYSSENQGFLYLKSLHVTSIEPNMDKGCRILYRCNGNPSQDIFGLMDCIVSCNFFMIKNSNYLTLSRDKACLLCHATDLHN